VYVAICVAFPVIGLIMGAIGVAGLKPREAYADDGGELVLARRP
jgi:hypothetical protein